MHIKQRDFNKHMEGQNRAALLCQTLHNSDDSDCGFNQTHCDLLLKSIAIITEQTAFRSITAL